MDQNFKIGKNILVKTLLFPLKCLFFMIKYPYRFKNVSTDSKKYPYNCWQLDTGIPLFFSKIQYLPLYTIHNVKSDLIWRKYSP